MRPIHAVDPVGVEPIVVRKRGGKTRIRPPPAARKNLLAISSDHRYKEFTDSEGM